ncbi:beta-defensin 135 [Nannospalax galili]|uniref:Beta-defensin n=1 Tax=Nannospalax galili TaxID=1026970 RepID=A0A8C6QH61_NANGA|nr:beta-defensin 135 [Nannospalax galili]
MRSLLLVLVVFVLLSYVPPVRSGPNMYISRIFSTCWLTKGTCRVNCVADEVYYIFCGTYYKCCISKKDMPVLIG